VGAPAAVNSESHQKDAARPGIQGHGTGAALGSEPDGRQRIRPGETSWITDKLPSPWELKTVPDWSSNAGRVGARPDCHLGQLLAALAIGDRQHAVGAGREKPVTHPVNGKTGRTVQHPARVQGGLDRHLLGCRYRSCPGSLSMLT